MWGPLGAFLAVPLLMVMAAIVSHAGSAGFRRGQLETALAGLFQYMFSKGGRI